MDKTLAIEKLKAENAKLEAEIEKMTASKVGIATATFSAENVVPEGGCIRVKQYGVVGARAEFAGINNGSNFRPPQTKRRTNLGGFFTS